MMPLVPTALGDIQLSELGRTLSHEHLFMNLMLERRGDGLVHDEELLAEELAVFAAQGGRTIFELTTAELNVGSTPAGPPEFDAGSGQTRNPRAVEGIQRISRKTGINVLLGTGRYRDPYLRASVIDSLGVEGVAEEMIRDLTAGFPGTTARAALIGEVGADKWYISEQEACVFRAAARAHRETGAVVYTHAARWEVAFEQIDLLRREGVDPAKIAVGHVDTVPSADFVTRVAGTGVFVGVDTINSANLREVRHRVQCVLELVSHGYLDRVLLAHDVCLASQLRSNGGNGFGFVLGGFRDALLDAGLSETEFDEIVVMNPARLLGHG